MAANNMPNLPVSRFSEEEANRYERAAARQNGLLPHPNMWRYVRDQHAERQTWFFTHGPSFDAWMWGNSNRHQMARPVEEVRDPGSTWHPVVITISRDRHGEFDLEDMWVSCPGLAAVTGKAWWVHPSRIELRRVLPPPLGLAPPRQAGQGGPRPGQPAAARPPPAQPPPAQPSAAQPAPQAALALPGPCPIAPATTALPSPRLAHDASVSSGPSDELSTLLRCGYSAHMTIDRTAVDATIMSVEGTAGGRIVQLLIAEPQKEGQSPSASPAQAAAPGAPGDGAVASPVVPAATPRFSQGGAEPADASAPPAAKATTSAGAEEPAAKRVALGPAAASSGSALPADARSWMSEVRDGRNLGTGRAKSVPAGHKHQVTFQ